MGRLATSPKRGSVAGSRKDAKGVFEVLNQAIRSYSEFNQRRYSNPWVARVDERGKLDFSVKVGAYTGGYNRGEAGELYVYDQKEGAVYAYGQKDNRGSNGGYQYVQYKGGAFVEVDKAHLLDALKGE